MSTVDWVATRLLYVLPVAALVAVASTLHPSIVLTFG